MKGLFKRIASGVFATAMMVTSAGLVSFAVDSYAITLVSGTDTTITDDTKCVDVLINGVPADFTAAVTAATGAKISIVPKNDYKLKTVTGATVKETDGNAYATVASAAIELKVDVEPINECWINGGDTKAVYTDKTKTTIKTPADINKSWTTDLVAMYSGGKWTPVITTDAVSTKADLEALFDATKGKFNTDTKLTTAAKSAKASIKDGTLTVTAGKEAGTVNVWICEIKNKKIVDTGDTSTDIQPWKFTVNVKTASAKVELTADAAATDITALKSVDVALGGDAVTAYIKGYAKKAKTADGCVVSSAETNYTVAFKSGAEYATAVYDPETESIKITAAKLANGKNAKATLVITEIESKKVTNLTVNVYNPLKTIAPTTEGEAAVTIQAGNTAAVVKEIALTQTANDDVTVKTTDKLATTTYTKATEADCFTVVKHKVVNEKDAVSKTVKSALTTDGKVKITVPKACAAGTYYTYVFSTNAYADPVKTMITVTVGAANTVISSVKPTLAKIVGGTTTANPDAGAETGYTAATTWDTAIVEANKAEYSKTYTATIVLTASEGYEFKAGLKKAAVTAPDGYTVTDASVADGKMTIKLAITTAAQE